MDKMRLESRSQQIIKKMSEQGKATLIGDPFNTNRYRIAAERIIKESRRKQKASRYYIGLVESGMINYLK